MIEENDTSPPPQTTQPELSNEAECRNNLAGQGDSDSPTSGESFVAAFIVSREKDGSLMLSTPLADGKVWQMLANVPWSAVAASLTLVPRLPIKDLSNPLVALVTRPSLARLVEAARKVVAGDEAPPHIDHDAVKALDAALEPFRDLAHG